MRFTAIACVLAGLLVTTASAADHFAGAWKLDLSKSSNNWGEKRTFATVRTYTPAADGGYDIKIDDVDANGKPESRTLKSTHNTERAIPSPFGSKGLEILQPTHVIVRRVDDRTMIATYRRNGKDIATSKSTISADGRTLTMAMDGTAPDGKKLKGVNVYTKQ